MLPDTIFAIKNSPIAPSLIWEDLIAIPTLEAAALQVATVYDFHRHPYIIWMQSNSTSRDAFRRSQLPFRFAVESFSQALAAVLARTPLLEARLPLAENVAEEHGHGECLRSHKYTFRQYLCALGATATELEIPCSTNVLAFNQSILTYCLTQPGEAGAAMLGIIEYLYVGISGSIAHTVCDRAWTTPGSQSHYAVHEKLDTEHARDLLILAEPAWHESRSRVLVAQGLVLGAHYFWSLYRDLQPSL
ncbi:iron-containing redox enzyme family protein [Aerosakkonema funiforme]|uniref:iron-containing redox enzyme family protein n=1 Tax=Aerosakkonema funiforme TaxID=1246630 RepID=UPI0035B9EEEE